MVETYDHTVTAEFEGQDEDMARLLGRLVQSGIVVQSFAEEPLSPRGSLHDDHQGDRELTTGRRSDSTSGPRSLHQGSDRTMLFRDNPVLTRELLVTLRSPRAFVLQLLYVCRAGGARLLLLAGGRGGVRGRSARAWPGGSSTSSSSASSSWSRSWRRPSPPGASPARRSGRPTRCSWPARSGRRRSWSASCSARSPTW